MSANGLPMIFNVNGLGDAKFSCTLSVADDGNSFNLNCDGNIMIGNIQFDQNGEVILVIQEIPKPTMRV